MEQPDTLAREQAQLVEQVQFNCDISDANHAGNYTLCIYLLKMREYFRWIHALDFEQPLDSERMSQWLREKEDIWDKVVDTDFKPINYQENEFDPFDSTAINAQIESSNLFYHAGIGQKAAQHFFIADLADQYHHEDIQISITAKEHARDLTAPPAISTTEEIIVRQESLKRMCWERYQEWHWSNLQNPMGTALSYYPFADSIPEALQLMVETEQDTLIHHELGEMQITRQWGEQWTAMMPGLLGSKAELLARAVRDHLADCLVTIPRLLEIHNPASIHFYFANLTPIRKDLFPSALQAYRHWVDTSKPRDLEKLSARAALHWEKTLQSILAIHRSNPENPAAEIVAMIEDSRY